MRIALALLWLILSLGSAACQDGSLVQSPAASEPDVEFKPSASPPAQIATVAPAYVARTRLLETTGKVQFNDEALARVHAPVTGRVTEVLARPGDVVEAGQALVVLDSSDLGLAKSDYAKAVADVERSAAALQLARELFEIKAVAQKEIRDAESESRKAAAERERAASRLRTLGVRDGQLGDIATRSDASTTIVVTAPRSGVVVERNVTPGQVVAYAQSDSPVNLFVIADLRTMWVVADIYEPDVPKVRLRQPVVVTLPCCPGERYDGQIVNVSDGVDMETGNLKVLRVAAVRRRKLKVVW